MAMYFYATKLSRKSRKHKMMAVPFNFDQHADDCNVGSSCKGSTVGCNTTCSGPITTATTTTSCAIQATSLSCEEENQEKLNCDEVESDFSQDTNGCTGNEGNNVASSSSYASASSSMPQTLDTLIKHLIPTETYFPDRIYIFEFLLTSRLYIPQQELLLTIFHELINPADSSGLDSSGDDDDSINQEVEKLTGAARERGSRGKIVPLIPNLMKLLAEWTCFFPYDFRDESMMRYLRTITQNCIALCPVIQNNVSQLVKVVLSKLTELDRYEAFLQRINSEFIGEPIAAPSILIVCPNSSTLAETLAHIELDRLQHIGLEEFIQNFRQDNSRNPLGNSCKDNIKRTHNYEAYLQWFNRLSLYVASEICNMSKKKTRVKVLEYWIEVVRVCFNNNNFNSTMSILTALNLPPVSRLKKTWSKVSTAELDKIEQKMSSESNFSRYRSLLQKQEWSSSTSLSGGCSSSSTSKKLVIPYFSLFLKDLNFINEASVSMLPNGSINYEKIRQIGQQISRVSMWQKSHCPSPKIQSVFQSIQSAPIYTYYELQLASFDCESAGSIEEKERLKCLCQEYAQKQQNKTPVSPHHHHHLQMCNCKASEIDVHLLPLPANGL